MSDLEFDPIIANVARTLREPVQLDAGFDARVMTALEPPVVSLDSRRRQVPWYRRTFAVSTPMAGLAAAAAIAGIAAVGLIERTPQAPAQVAAADAPTLVPVAQTDQTNQEQQVLFLYVAPEADSVSVIGTFNDWQPVPMTFDSAHGAWSVTLPVPVGNHQYQYVINGTTHVTDPRAPQASGDFGSPNSVLTISAR